MMIILVTLRANEIINDVVVSIQVFSSFSLCVLKKKNVLWTKGGSVECGDKERKLF